MTQHHTCDICVIGAGSGGLSVAAGASQMGASVVLIEKADMGGDCLNTGCVPSKALLAAAHAAQAAKRADRFGVKTGKVSANPKKTFAHVRLFDQHNAGAHL
ncbi:FAD-dependent oxidoreductase [Pseudomonadota bacterium]